MNWKNYVVKLNIKSNVIDFKHPLNIFKTSNSTGTGFFISKTLILTCYHVIQDAINIDVEYKQIHNIPAKIKKIFPDDDLAIIQINQNFDDIKVLKLKPINDIQTGDVYTIGFPLYSTNIKITKGIIAGYQESLIQTDSTLNPGNSGGPLVIFDESDKEYKVIGVNVSKMKSKGERAGFVVPIYRFLITMKYLETPEIVIKKPLLSFDYQEIIQDQLKQNIFKNEKLKKIINNQIGIRVSMLNDKYYFSKNIKPNDIILSINDKWVDSNGKVKFDFYPESISIDDIGLWFVPGDLLEFSILDVQTQEVRKESIILQVMDLNLTEYFNLPNYPKYFVENNGLILSVFTKKHFESLKDLNLDLSQMFKLINRNLYHQDLFTVYLADLDYRKLSKFIKYPIGEIIIEINGQTFNNYEEFITIIQNPIKIIKTIENDIYYL